MALAASQAQSLKVTTGTPGLYLTRTTCDQHDNVIEFAQEFWRHDVLELEIDVETDAVAVALAAVNGP
jgi:DNA-binding GntR family transcriptional regulator